MTKYFVADSYKDMEQIGTPFENKKGRKVIRVKTKCPRCGGLGIIVSHVENGNPIPIPVDGGVCYKCGGSRFIEKTVRVYTEKEYNTLQRTKERNKRKKEEEAALKMKDAMEKANEYKHSTALKLGFNEDESIYIVYGDNTYAIKDELKEKGARFNPTFKWFFKEEVELPEGYGLCSFSFDELYDYHAANKWADLKEGAEALIRKRIVDLKGPSSSVYYPAEEKSRIRNISATIKSIRGFDGYYGYTNIYTFASDNYVFVWMTSKDLDVAVGDEVDLTGTIKKFDEYMGVAQTYLTRCIVKKEGM